jgi:site-specific recombinase XerD
MRLKEVTTLTPESIERFRNWSIARGQSENTARAYSSDLREFLRATGETTISLDEYEELAMSWLNLTRKDVSPKTTGRRLTSLRAFAKWSGLAGCLGDYRAPTPGKGVPHPIPERMEGIERLLMVAANAEQRALVGLCGYAGLRVGEALACRVTWLDMHEMILRVRGKGDKERFVPVSDRAWSAISTAYVDAAMGDGTLIHYQDRSARKCITSLGRKAGLARPIASHDLRATFATVLGERGVHQRVVQELLGHANGSTTEIYMGVTHKSMREAVQF